MLLLWHEKTDLIFAHTLFEPLVLTLLQKCTCDAAINARCVYLHKQ